MSPATVLQTPPKFKEEVTRYEYTKYSILKHIFENQPMPISDLYTYIDQNERRFAFPPGILSFEYIDILLEYEVIRKNNDKFEITKYGIDSYHEIKNFVELV